MHTGFWWGNQSERPLGRPRHRWEGNATMGFKEISWESVNWVDGAQERDKWHALMNVAMNCQFPYNVGNLLSQGTKLLKKNSVPWPRFSSHKLDGCII